MLSVLRWQLDFIQFRTAATLLSCAFSLIILTKLILVTFTKLSAVLDRQAGSIILLLKLMDVNVSCLVIFSSLKFLASSDLFRFLAALSTMLSKTFYAMSIDILCLHESLTFSDLSGFFSLSNLEEND